MHLFLVYLEYEYRVLIVEKMTIHKNRICLYNMVLLRYHC